MKVKEMQFDEFSYMPGVLRANKNYEEDGVDVEVQLDLSGYKNNRPYVYGVEVEVTGKKNSSCIGIVTIDGEIEIRKGTLDKKYEPLVLSAMDFLNGILAPSLSEESERNAAMMGQIQLDRKVTTICKYGSFEGYSGYYVLTGQRLGGLSIQGAWQSAKSGLLKNVIATGDVKVPTLTKEQEEAEQTYEFEPEELKKMCLAGINGFNMDDLPHVTEDLRGIE